MKRLLKNMLFTLVSLVIFICLAEFSTRLAALAYTKSVYALTYGIDKAVKVNIRNKKIAFIRYGSAGKEGAELKAQTGPAAAVRLAAFGGSTTFGFFLGRASSSWPDELQRILNERHSKGGTRFEVINLAANGANSDYSAEKLPFSGCRGDVDIILWANFVNESDVMYFGPKRNIEALYREFGNVLGKEKLSFAMNRYFMYCQRLDETFKKYSLFYNLLYSIIHREMTQAIKVRPDIEQRWLKAGIADRLIEMGLRNYELNFFEAKKFCDENRIRLVLVRLPMLEGAQEDKAQLPVVSIFRERLDRMMLKLSGEHGAGFIDVNSRYKDITGCERFFYDSAHQNRYGNALTAEMIAEGLRAGLYE